MRRLLVLFLFFSLLAGSALAQTESRILFLTEGATDGGFGSVDPQTGAVETFDTLAEPTFNSSYDDVLVHQDRVYVCGGNANLLVYDVHTMNLVDSLSGFVPRKLAVYEDWLLMTTFDAPYFRAFNLDDLSPAWDLDSTKVTDEAEAMVVRGDTAYVAVNGLNGFGDNGRVGQALVVIHLPVQDTIATVTVGSNPTALMVTNDNLYIKAQVGDFPTANSELIGFDLISQSIISRDTLLDSDFYGPTATDGTEIYYQDTTPALVAWNPATNTTTAYLSGSFYAAHYAPDAGAFLLSQGGFGADTARVLLWSPVGIGFGQADTFLLETTNGVFNSPRTLHWAPAPAFSAGVVSGAEIAPGVYCSDSALNITFEQPEWLTQATTDILGADVAHGATLELQPLELPTDTYAFTTTMGYLGMSLQATTNLSVEVCVSGVADDLVDAVRVFPNPTTDRIQIALDTPRQGKLVVYDSQGRVLHSQGIVGQTSSIACSEWSAGVYVVRFVGENSVFTTRVVKQ